MSFCCVTVSFRFAISHATLSRLVPRPSPLPENSKLKVLLLPVNIVVSFLRLLYPLVILLSSRGGGKPCCADDDASPRELVGSPPGSPLGGSAISLQIAAPQSDPLTLRCSTCTSSLTLKLQCLQASLAFPKAVQSWVDLIYYRHYDPLSSFRINIPLEIQPLTKSVSRLEPIRVKRELGHR